MNVRAIEFRTLCCIYNLNPMEVIENDNIVNCIKMDDFEELERILVEEY